MTLFRSPIPNNSTKAVCHLYGLCSLKNQDEVFENYIALRKRSINQLLVADSTVPTNNRRSEAIHRLSRINSARSAVNAKVGFRVDMTSSVTGHHTILSLLKLHHALLDNNDANM